MQYILTLWATLAVLSTAASGKKYARLWSGDFDACNKTEWSVEEEQLASSRKNMEVSHFWQDPCIAEQKDRKAVWVPSLDKDYCLVGSPDAHCPEKGGYMSGDIYTVTIVKDGRLGLLERLIG